MSQIIVCPLHDHEALLSVRQPSHVLSLISPTTELDHLRDQTHLILRFHDISAPQQGLIAPDPHHVQQIVDFVTSWSGEQPLLIHCWAGVSRSTAAAYVAACVATGPGSEERLANSLRLQAPYATPNRLIVQLADELLQRGGAMSDAIHKIGRGCDTCWGSSFAFNLQAKKRAVCTGQAYDPKVQ